MSIYQRFDAACPPLADRATFHEAVAHWLRRHPELIDQWQTYSADKRTSPSPYFGRDAVPLEVGFYSPDVGLTDVSQRTPLKPAPISFIERRLGSSGAATARIRGVNRKVRRRIG